ncbi:MAG: hypothetical protein K0Q94_3681, partial [Paenibacillus sp.]|nr:hypothetical protein [Paenibacillus sp.]
MFLAGNSRFAFVLGELVGSETLNKTG